jgi:hypothetical protein
MLGPRISTVPPLANRGSLSLGRGEEDWSCLLVPVAGHFQSVVLVPQASGLSRFWWVFTCDGVGGGLTWFDWV